MFGNRSATIVFLGCALGAASACSEIVGADFDVHLRPVDGAAPTSSDASNDAGRNNDVNVDRAESDGITLDARSTDVRDASLDAGAPDVRSDIAGIDGGERDASVDRVGPDAQDGGNGGNVEDVADDIFDASTDPHDDVGPGRPTIVSGGFVSLGDPSPPISTVQLRGQIISGGSMRGVNATGITIEGRFQ